MKKIALSICVSVVMAVGLAIAENKPVCDGKYAWEQGELVCKDAAWALYVKVGKTESVSVVDGLSKSECEAARAKVTGEGGSAQCVKH